MLTGLYAITYEVTPSIQFCIGLCNLTIILSFCRQIDRIARHNYFAILDPAVGRLKETHFIDLSMHTKRGDKTDIWALRRFNCT